ncbi:Putative monooxygenase [Halioglobus japonicus]|nr:Putative monooxygenase [Halioglobus japonicus]
MGIKHSDKATLQQRLNIEVPIIQAPMAGVQGAELAAAISNAGGLGSLPCAMLNPSALKDELQRLTALTDKPFNVNFFCHKPATVSPLQTRSWFESLSPYFQELNIEAPGEGPGASREPFGDQALEVLEQFKPAVVSFHFGLPEPAQLQQLKSWGARILSSATTVEEARWLEDNGVDIVIAQGVEAGGHRGSFLTQDMTTQTGTMAFVPRVCAAVSVPVIAAGGIASAEGVAAAMMLGSAGVQIGTTFLLCPEAKTSALHRAALKSEAVHHTALTNVFTGKPARSIVNRLVREVGPMADTVSPFPSAAGPVSLLRAAAEPNGNDDFTPLWSGQNATGCQEIPAAELLQKLSAAR